MPSAALRPARLDDAGGGGRCNEVAAISVLGTALAATLICDQGSEPHGLHHDPFDRLWWKADGDD